VDRGRGSELRWFRSQTNWQCLLVKVGRDGDHPYARCNYAVVGSGAKLINWQCLLVKGGSDGDQPYARCNCAPHLRHQARDLALKIVCDLWVYIS
jgi:hypothetical protein